ncbi:MAG: hypothetical protein ACREUF_16450, partial [Solimonas sp.]
MSANTVTNLVPHVPQASDVLAGLLARQRAALQARGEPSSLARRREMLRKLEQALMERRLQLADAMA